MSSTVSFLVFFALCTVPAQACFLDLSGSTLVPGVFLAGCVGGDDCRPHPSYQAAAKLCMQKPAECGGVVETGGHFEMRSGKNLEKSAANENSWLCGQCSWTRHENTFLPGCVKGDECKSFSTQVIQGRQVQGRTTAELACMAAGRQCGGILVAPNGKWEIRSGDQPQQSSNGEATVGKKCTLSDGDAPNVVESMFPAQAHDLDGNNEVVQRADPDASSSASWGSAILPFLLVAIVFGISKAANAHSKYRQYTLLQDLGKPPSSFMDRLTPLVNQALAIMGRPPLQEMEPVGSGYMPEDEFKTQEAKDSYRNPYMKYEEDEEDEDEVKEKMLGDMMRKAGCDPEQADEDMDKKMSNLFKRHEEREKELPAAAPAVDLLGMTDEDVNVMPQTDEDDLLGL